MEEYNTIIVNGKKINFTGNAIINIKKDTSGEKEKKFDTDNKSRMLIEIEGDVGDLKCGDANIYINGDVGKVVSKNGNVKCNNITGGRVACMSLSANIIEGTINTTGDIITEKFIGNTNVGKVIETFKPIKHRDELKEKMTIFHTKYGKGIIEDKYAYQHTGGSIRVNFDSESIVKSLQIDSLITNKSISQFSSEKIDKIYEEEFID